ncbi:MAG: hypothetical protein EAY75_07485 [Bacteroidetes bacterium]|nr:MAG: hypothetical protein EAY75_07485 [Bacteroidota bacterium]
MNEDQQEPLNPEDLEAENTFLKMKMMLENGAQFGTMDGASLPPDLENAFLKNIMAFEQQFQQQKTTTVFAKIGKPTRFKPIAELRPDEIEAAWRELDAHMQDHGVQLSAISPNVSTAELYRFTIEELFEHDMDDMDVPGMTSHFTYDEFYPDYKYDNTRYAIDECLALIFNKDAPDMWLWLKNEVCLNNSNMMPRDEFIALVERFKSVHDSLTLVSAEATDCQILETNCVVKGTYAATGSAGLQQLNYEGQWTVTFYFDDNAGYYGIQQIQIEGVNF